MQTIQVRGRYLSPYGLCHNLQPPRSCPCWTPSGPSASGPPPPPPHLAHTNPESQPLPITTTCPSLAHRHSPSTRRPAPALLGQPSLLPLHPLPLLPNNVQRQSPRAGGSCPSRARAPAPRQADHRNPAATAATATPKPCPSGLGGWRRRRRREGAHRRCVGHAVHLQTGRGGGVRLQATATDVGRDQWRCLGTQARHS